MRTKLPITKILACLGALTGCVGVSGLGVAADNCSGTWVQIGSAIVSLNDDPQCAFAHGCRRLFFSTFRCTYKDGDGDIFTNESSPSQGKWRTVSGTGKYANSTSSGWTKIMKSEFKNPEGMIYIGVWGGECVM